MNNKYDPIYGHFKNISEFPEIVNQRLEHYFLTFKDMPGEEKDTEIAGIYGVEDAHQVIRKSVEDYIQRFDNLGKFL